MAMIKTLLPRSLLGRSLLIVVTPLFLLQAVSAFVFFEGHWETVSRRLAANLVGDIAVLAAAVGDHPDDEYRAWVFDQAARYMAISATFTPGAVLPNRPATGGGSLEETLAGVLESDLGRPYRIDTRSLDDQVIVDIQLGGGVLRAVTGRKRLFSTTTYAFVLWMAGLALLLFGVATIFMRNQVKPILRLAQAADSFGKGRDFARFKPEGALEVRQAAAAFIAMRQRLKRQIDQRTAMLAGVSHDLRTPLTRMKLELALMPEDDGTAALKQDVAEMERMLEAYLAFARGEGAEVPAATDLGRLIDVAVQQARRQGAAIAVRTEGDLVVPLRPLAVQRCLANLIDNAARYGRNVTIEARRRGEAVEVIVDDDGPGIPEHRREDVFRPFFRLEGSRNPETGGVGLGLAIARDVVRSHGGDLALGVAPQGGLRARLRLPA
jgi:two-component system osmolarity sensor histidine kinase EnvZ